MRKLLHMIRKTIKPDTFLFDNTSNKVIESLISHVYAQTVIAMIASTFCASIVFAGLFSLPSRNTALYIWFGFFLLITFGRIFLSFTYEKQDAIARDIDSWRNMYILGAALGGMSWGLAGIILFPDANPAQQTLLILMLAGVTAGAVPLSSAIPAAAIAFLTFSLLPFIITIALTGKRFGLLFDAALFLYLIYSITLVLGAYKLIKRSMILKFENYSLLNNLKVINKKLEQAAMHDPLTQVANRRLFQFNLEKAIENAKKNQKYVALLYIDIDHFKEINDCFGHQAGDYILVIIVERINKFLGTSDAIARLGGDEIAVILENVNSVEEIIRVAKKVCNLFLVPIEIKNQPLKVSASIGISIYPIDADNAEVLVKKSDDHMYYVKEHGGNNIYFSKESVE